MKHLCILILTLFLSFHLLGEEPAFLDKITLNSGEVYVGEIVVKTSEIIMIKTQNGARYQFQLTEIRQVEKIPIAEQTQNQTKISGELIQQEGNFSGQLEFDAGISNAKFAFTSSPNMQVSLTFGNKKIFGKDLFLGVGAGYNKTLLEPNATSVDLIPVFVRAQSTLSKKHTAPYFGVDAGYTFSTATNYDGGTFVKFSIGLSHRLNHKTALITGLYAGLNSISGNLTETNNLGTFSYYGNTVMKNLGLKLGLQF